MSSLTDNSIYRLIHGDADIYDFDPRQWERDGFVDGPDLQGWGGHSEFFEGVLHEWSVQRWREVDFTRSLEDLRLFVEVGSWKGRSAAAIGSLLKERCPNAVLLCVDTWLGATEFWADHDDEKRYGSLRLYHGYPNVYYQFLYNMKTMGLDDVVIPFPQTSLNAARLLHDKGVTTDVVYIDGSHEYEDVESDIVNWRRTLRRGTADFDVRGGSVMCGDDYCEYWSGVRDAVDDCFLRGTVNHKQFQNGEGRPPSDYWIWRDERW